MRAFVVISTVLVVTLAAGVYFLTAPGQTEEAEAFSAERTLERIDGSASSTLESIANNVRGVVEAGGIEGALKVVNLAFEQKRIHMNDCHALSHLVGHYAPNYFEDDFEALVEYSSHECARGYFHGAEAQLVLEGGGDYRDRLGTLCKAQKRKDPDMTCFHGAGHAFMNETLDVARSLELCDSLEDQLVAKEQNSDVPDCYEAVFSELTNLVGGFDGETGMPYEGEPPLSIDVRPIEYCAQLDQKFHVRCALEFSSVGLGTDESPEEAGARMRECVTDAPTHELSKACLYNTAASYVRHEVERDGQVTFQPWIREQSHEVRVLYLVAVGQEIAQHLNSGHDIDTDTFCESFPLKEEIALCKEQVHSYTWVAHVLDK